MGFHEFWFFNTRLVLRNLGLKFNAAAARVKGEVVGSTF
jgi:hypothetical protein